MSDRPTAANRDIQQVPTNVVETPSGARIPFKDAEAADAYAEQYGGKAGQLIHGEVIR